MTTQQAASILKVSRPFVVTLVENGELPARQVGNRLRLPLQDVLNYKAANGPRRRVRQTAPAPIGWKETSARYTGGVASRGRLNQR